MAQTLVKYLTLLAHSSPAVMQIQHEAALHEFILMHLLEQQHQIYEQLRFYIK